MQAAWTMGVGEAPEGFVFAGQKNYPQRAVPPSSKRPCLALRLRHQFLGPNTEGHWNSGGPAPGLSPGHPTHRRDAVTMGEVASAPLRLRGALRMRSLEE